MKNTLRGPLIILCFTVLNPWGCAEDIKADKGDDSVGTLVQSTEQEGATITVVDASDAESWIYMDLETGEAVSPDDPATDKDWDLAFQRHKIKSNGGISGPGSVEILRLMEVDFKALDEAPEDPYLTDADDSDDSDDQPDYVFLGPDPWYDYDQEEHTLSPKDAVYVVHTGANKYYKFQMLNYYDQNGTSGFPSFQWSEINKPSGNSPKPEPSKDELIVDTNGSTNWIYVSLNSKKLMTPETPEADKNWDIAISGKWFRTNSGSSGEGAGGAMESSTAWDDTETSATLGYIVDSVEGSSDNKETSVNPVLNTWHQSDDETKPRDVVFLVRTGTGTYKKLQILKYEEGTYTLRIGSVTKTVKVHETQLDASSHDSFVHFDFETGKTVEPEDPKSDTSWDIALSTTKVRTNSGTSGSGQAGVLATDFTDIMELTKATVGEGCYMGPTGDHKCYCEKSKEKCTEDGGVWTSQCGCETAFPADEMLPIPGTAEDGEYSGHPVLSKCWDYEEKTEAVKASSTVFLVRTATGAYAKVQFTNYDTGKISFVWAFAGPEQFTF